MTRDRRPLWSAAMGRFWLVTKVRLYRVVLAAQWRLEAAAIFVILQLCRRLGVDRASALGGRVAAALGPRLGVSRYARAQLTAALPASDAEGREALVGAVWRNLGRYFTEYAHLAEIWPPAVDPQALTRIAIAPEVIDRFVALREDGRPAILFTGHIGNWELLPVGAARFGLDLAVMFRRPNNPYAEKVLLAIRGAAMGELIPAGFQAGLAAARVLEAGGHLGMLVDQHFSRGPAVPFFGRPARTAPTLAKLARHFRCPVHGAWAERLDGARFRIHLTPALDLDAAYADPDARRAEQAIMAKVTAELECWVRARPGQWNWLHRRWR